MRCKIALRLSELLKLSSLQPSEHSKPIFNLFVITLGVLFNGPVYSSCKDSIEKTAPLSRFTINGDGTVTDKKTGLMWMRCSIGQNATSPSCSGTPVDWNWSQAIEPSYIYFGYTDWRVPNIKELESIVERACSFPAFNLSVFPNVPSDNNNTYYWSSSVYPPIPGYSRAFALRIPYGLVRARERSSLGHVRLVRDP